MGNGFQPCNPEYLWQVAEDEDDATDQEENEAEIPKTLED